MSNTDAIASRQRDCRTSAKSRIDSRSNRSYSAGQLAAAGRAPSPDQADASTTRRSVLSSSDCVGDGAQRRLAGPPHRHRQVVDQQRRDQRRQVPAGLAAGGQEDQLGARLGRVGPRQHAVGLDAARRATAARPDPRPGRSASATGGGRSAGRWSRPPARRPPAGARRRPGSSPRSARRCGGRRLAAVPVDHQVGLGPDPGQLLLDVVDGVRASTSSASSARRAAAGPRARSARRPPAASRRR